VIHDGMPYDPIQGPGHVGLKVAKMPTSKSISSLRRYARNQKTNGIMILASCLVLTFGHGLNHRRQRMLGLSLT